MHICSQCEMSVASSAIRKKQFAARISVESCLKTVLPHIAMNSFIIGDVLQTKKEVVDKDFLEHNAVFMVATNWKAEGLALSDIEFIVGGLSLQHTQQNILYEDIQILIKGVWITKQVEWTWKMTFVQFSISLF